MVFPTKQAATAWVSKRNALASHWYRWLLLTICGGGWERTSSQNLGHILEVGLPIIAVLTQEMLELCKLGGASVDNLPIFLLSTEANGAANRNLLLVQVPLSEGYDLEKQRGKQDWRCRARKRHKEKNK